MAEVQRLIAELADPDAIARWSAAGGLWDIARASTENAELLGAVPALARALKDGNGDVRMNAAGALGQIAVANRRDARILVAVPALADALMKIDKRARENIAWALGSIAEANPGDARILEAAPPLVGAMNDKSDFVREKAAWALRVIVNGCDKIEALEIFEKELNEGAASLRKSTRNKLVLHDAMMTLAELMRKVVKRKNELARAEMRDLMLAGERPRPPKGGRNAMYQGMRTRPSR